MIISMNYCNICSSILCISLPWKNITRDLTRRRCVYGCQMKKSTSIEFLSLQIILNLYGEYLVETNAHAEAGIGKSISCNPFNSLSLMLSWLSVFKLAKEPGKALNAYKLADAWREVFALAGEMQLTEQEIQDLAYTMIGRIDCIHIPKGQIC